MYTAQAQVVITKPLFTTNLDPSIQSVPQTPEGTVLRDLALAVDLLWSVYTSPDITAVLDKGLSFPQFSSGMSAKLAGTSKLILNVSASKPETAATIVNAWAEEFTGRDFKNIGSVPELFDEVLPLDISRAVKILSAGERAYVLGIDGFYGVAGEFAVKLGEAAQIQATALPAPEISHGPKASVRNVPVILFAMQKEHERLFAGLLTELKEAGAKTIVCSPEHSSYDADIGIKLPGDGDSGIFSAVKLSQRLAVETAIVKGLNPDHPPTLKKFVKRKNL